MHGAMDLAVRIWNNFNFFPMRRSSSFPPFCRSTQFTDGLLRAVTTPDLMCTEVCHKGIEPILSCQEDVFRIEDPHLSTSTDVHRAHFHADEVRDVCVRLPDEHPRRRGGGFPEVASPCHWQTHVLVHTRMCEPSRHRVHTVANARAKQGSLSHCLEHISEPVPEIHTVGLALDGECM